MKTLTIYRGDFRPHADDGSSMFEGILSQLGIDQDKWDNIEEVEIKVDDFDFEEED